MKIDFAGISNKGSRKKNEDYLDYKEINNSFYFALADGLGGHKGGEIASKTAIQASLNLLSIDTNIDNSFISQCFIESQKQILNKQLELNSDGLKTTLVLLLLHNYKAITGHVGDTRLYIFRSNKIIYQTKDHSVSQMLAESGEIKEKEIRFHCDRNRLTKALGSNYSGMSQNYEIYKDGFSLKKNDKILMATDGFWELITEKTMKMVLRKNLPPQDSLDMMEKILLENGKIINMDNYTAYLIFIN